MAASALDDPLELVRSFLHGRLGTDPAQVTTDAHLGDLGIDSLILLELFFEFEERAGVRLAKDLPAPKTVGDLIGIVERLKTA